MKTRELSGRPTHITTEQTLLAPLPRLRPTQKLGPTNPYNYRTDIAGATATIATNAEARPELTGRVRARHLGNPSDNWIKTSRDPKEIQALQFDSCDASGCGICED